MGSLFSPSLFFDLKISLVMWIQFNNAFLSIVENRDNKLELLVRARIKGDIEKIFPDAGCSLKHLWNFLRSSLNLKT